jgi:hypothetical protein
MELSTMPYTVATANMVSSAQTTVEI